MTVTTMPANYVGTPARVPVPYGLFSTFQFRPTSPSIRWEGAGVAFETVGCGPLKGAGFGADWCADPSTIPGLPFQFEQTGSEDGEAVPFQIIAPYKCSPVGNTEDAARTKAESKLLLFEERAVEHAFWTGLLGNTPNLRGAVELASGPVPFDVAVGLLEEFIAAGYGSQGVIHAPRAAVAGSPSSVKTAGGTLRTVLGTPVAAGSGYDGSGPDGAPAGPGVRFVYATPAMTGYRGEILTTALFDRANNDRIVYSARDYLLAFEDCGVACVPVAVGAVGDTATLETPPGSDPNPYLTT